MRDWQTDRRPGIEAAHDYLMKHELRQARRKMHFWMVVFVLLSIWFAAMADRALEKARWDVQWKNTLDAQK